MGGSLQEIKDSHLNQNSFQLLLTLNTLKGPQQFTYLKTADSSMTVVVIASYFQ